MKTLFMDTGYIIALEASDDKNHKAAVRHWRNLTKSLPLLVTKRLNFRHFRHFSPGPDLAKSDLAKINQDW